MKNPSPDPKQVWVAQLRHAVSGSIDFTVTATDGAGQIGLRARSTSPADQRARRGRDTDQMIDDALDDLSRAVTTFGLDPVLGAVVSSLVSHDDRWASDPRWYEPFGSARIPSFTVTVTEAVDDGSEAPSELLGALHEGLRSRSDRRRNGAVYTPAAVADRLVGQAFTGLDVPRAVCDPAAGGGAFLLAAAVRSATPG